MDDDQVRRAIEELERGLTQAAIDEAEQALAHDDPALVKRTRAFYRAEVRTALAVFLLLATGAVLLTVGVSTLSWPAWVAGLVAFLASFAANEHHKHVLRRYP